MSAIVYGVEVDAVKFDLDGTMVGYLPVVVSVAHKLVTEYLARCGKLINQLDIELFRGRPVLHAARDVLQQHGVHADDDVLEHLFWRHHDAVNERLTAEGLSTTQGLPDLLAKLQLIDLALSVVSSNTHMRIDLCLELAGIAQFFDRARRFSSYAPHIEGHKPNPAVYRHAATSQNLKPSRCAAVEDSVHGVSAAVAAEIGVVIGYVGDYAKQVRDKARRDLYAAGAHCVIEHWREFPLQGARHSLRSLPTLQRAGQS